MAFCAINNRAALVGSRHAVKPPASLANPCFRLVTMPHNSTVIYTAVAEGATDFRVADDSLMNCDAEMKGLCAEASASREGSDDTELMSNPADIPREEQEVFFSEEQMSQPAPEMPNPTERASEFGQGESGGQSEQRSSSQEGGRFDEEPFTPEAPYSPKPKDRGHGIPPHKDETNTGPEGSKPGRHSSTPGSGGHPSGDEEIPAAAI